MAISCDLTSSSAMAERPRELGDFKKVDHFEAKFGVEGLRFAPMSMDRQIGEWSYYSAENFHTKKLLFV